MNNIQTRPLGREVPYLGKDRPFSSGDLSYQPYLSVRREMRVTTSQAKALVHPTNPWLALIALSFGAFVTVLGTSIISVALSTLQVQLHTDLTTASWVLHIYNLLCATCFITAGRLADIYGRKRFVLIGLLLFVTGSLLCGMSPSIWCLLGARALQASGAAIISAVSLALVYALFPQEQRGLSMSIFGSLLALAATIGPAIGGILLSHFGWRSIFFVNIPFCLIGFLLISFFLPEMKNFSEKRRIDLLGLATISPALFCLALAVIEGSDWGWISPQILSLFGWAVIGLVLFVFIERRHPSPLLDITLFFSPGFRLANVATFLYGVGLQSGSLFLSLYFLNARGETEVTTAVATFPVAIAACVIPNIMYFVGRFIAPWLRCVLGLCFMVLGLLLFCMLTMSSTYLDTMWRELIFGAGIGLCLASFPSVALADAPLEKLGVASGTLNTFRLIGYVLGAAFLMGIFSGQFNTNVQIARVESMTMIQTDAHLPIALRDALVAQFSPSNMQKLLSQRDLLQMTNNHPSWQSSRGELAILSKQIEQIFEIQVVHTYTSVWALAATFPMLGLVLVITFLIVTQQRFPSVKMQVSAWSTFYFFSLSGGITARTIQQYLTAQQLPLVSQSAQQANRRVMQANFPVQESFFVLS
jgi:EmrB/QacA subfamily drug resistance transporter